MRKILICLMSLILWVTSCSFCFGLENSNEKSISSPKIVAVLYDDSSSMHIKSNPSWAYANYAMQTFTGLLNRNDTLLLTYMSSSDSVLKSNADGVLSLFSSDRQDTVDKIRAKTESGDVTPFDGIDTVGNALASTATNDPNTQYWMVILTDGAFEKKPGDTNTETSSAEIQEKLAEYQKKKMPNGSNMKIIYMAIGDKAVLPTETQNLIVKHSSTVDIVNTLSEIADQVSGRYRLQDSDFKIKEGNKIEISSSVPLLNIRVLTQNTDAQVKSVSIKDGENLENSTVHIASPDNVSGRTKGQTLYGNISTITSKGNYIEDGKYEITFDNAIKKEDVVILYEAALETKMTITRDGKTITDPEVLREGDLLDISCKVVKMGTNKSIDLKKLPEGMYQGFSLNIDESGQNVVNTEEFTYKNYKVTKNDTTITATANLQGFAPLTKSVQFAPKSPVVYDIKAQDGDLQLSLGKIRNCKESCNFIVTGDGQPLSKSEIETLIDDDSIQITHGGEETGITYDYSIGKNGVIKVTPTTSWLNHAVLGTFTIPRGQYDVKVSLNKKLSAEDHFQVNFYSSREILWRIILLILFLIALRLTIFTKHFPSGKLERYEYQIDSSGKPTPLTRTKGPMKIGYFTDFFGPLYRTGPRKKTFDKDRKIVLTAKGQRRFDLDVKTEFNTGAETITPDTAHKLLERYMRLKAMKAAPGLLSKKDPTVVKMKKNKETFVDQSIGTTKLVENYKFK